MKISDNFNVIKTGIIITFNVVMIIIMISMIQWMNSFEVEETTIHNHFVIAETPKVLIVNQSIEEELKAGKGEKIYTIYDAITGNRDITYHIISRALQYDVPVNLAMAVCYEESRFYPWAVNGNHNADGSADYGLFQLNSHTYKKHTKEYLMVAEHNIDMGISHLRDNFKRYGNWTEAVIAYNCGQTESVPNQTLKYMIKVMAKKGEYDKLYFEELNRITGIVE